MRNAEPLGAPPSEYRRAKRDANSVGVNQNFRLCGWLGTAWQIPVRYVAARHLGGRSAPDGCPPAQLETARDPARNSDPLLRCDRRWPATLNRLPSIGVWLVGQDEQSLTVEIGCSRRECEVTRVEIHE